MKKFLINRKRPAVLIAAILLVLGSGVAYTQSLPSQMVETLLNSQFSKIKPESFHRVFEQWQKAEYGYVRNSFDQSEIQSVAASFTMWLLFNNPFTDADYVEEETTTTTEQGDGETTTTTRTTEQGDEETITTTTRTTEQGKTITTTTTTRKVTEEELKERWGR
jgi:hypothetical protein